jgi:hypothetical protein
LTGLASGIDWIAQSSSDSGDASASDFSRIVAYRSCNDATPPVASGKTVCKWRGGIIGDGSDSVKA